MLTAEIQDFIWDEIIDGINGEYVEAWGCAIAWYGDEVGAEYNLSYENGYNRSAIYRMNWDGDPNDSNSTISTDGGDFEHYEIDPYDPRWKEKLLDAMKCFVLERI